MLQSIKNAPTFTISGNAGEAGVELDWSDGADQYVLSGARGNFSITVAQGFSGTLTPSLPGCGFYPTNITFTNVQSNKIGVNFAVAELASPQFQAWPTKGKFQQWPTG